MIDFDKIKHYFRIFKDLKISDLEQLYKNCSVVNLKPGEYFIEQGTQKRIIGFIDTGLIRAFHLDEQGKETTLLLRWEDNFVASHDTILFDRPSRFNYQAMEKTRIITLNYDTIQAIIDTNPKFEQSRKHFLLKTIGELMNRLEAFVLLSPEERYREIITSNPSLINRVPDKYLANIIGITPVSLSRIRKRLNFH